MSRVAHLGAVVRPGPVLEEGLGPDEVARALGEAGTRGWIDLEGAAPAEIQALERCFRFHPLAIEDAQNPKTRPKIEEYENFLFVVTRAVNDDPGPPALDLIPLFVFLDDRLIVTVHDRPLRSVSNALERLRKHPEVLGDGPDRLFHHLLDQIVDSYFPIVEHVEERVDRLETRVFARPGSRLLERIFAARKDVVALRRGLGPLREVVANLMSGVPHVRAELRPFFRDVYDHVLRLLDELETNRDILSGLLEAYLSQINNRISIVMKQLAVLATIGLPFTIVTGFFGMNFKVMPWLDEPWGAAASVAIMAGLAVALFALFRWRRWL